MSNGNKAIRSLPYAVRLKKYEQEKEELFYKIRDMSAEDVSEAHRKLAEKWGI